MSTNPNNSNAVNLLKLAASVLSSSVSASRPIRDRTTFADGGQQKENKKNARIKLDGTVVTDADGAAQRIIFRGIRRISTLVRIVGEEDQKEMERLDNDNASSSSSDDGESPIDKQQEEDKIYRYALDEIHIRHRSLKIQSPLAEIKDYSDIEIVKQPQVTHDYDNDENADYVVDPSRVSVFVDPLDGTSSYANGNYDSVSILTAIVLDNVPWFGVICKPFGCENFPSVLDTGCMAIYGGHLLGGVFIAGGNKYEPKILHDNNSENLPRAILSPPPRSKGVCRDFVDYLASRGILHSEPIISSGAGEKSMRLVLSMNNEGLWFLPKPGTSRWDVAASDALLRSIGGCLTDKYGKELDYMSASRNNAENSDGIIACNNKTLHQECSRLFIEEKWHEKPI